MNDTLLQQWKHYIKNKNGRIIKNTGSSYNKYEAYQISYENNYKFIVTLHIQQEPAKVQGAHIIKYTKINTPFDNINAISLHINKKGIIKKLIEKFTSPKADLFTKRFYVKCSNAAVKTKLLSDTYMKQIILELEDIYINICSSTDASIPEVPDNNDVLEIYIDHIVTDDVTIEKINQLAVCLLSIIQHVNMAESTTKTTLN